MRDLVSPQETALLLVLINVIQEDTDLHLSFSSGYEQPLYFFFLLFRYQY